MPRAPRLFVRFPATGDAGLIVRWGRQQDESLDDQFAQSADRLASTFNGEPLDDFILLPWLFLYRHAIELSLKRVIVFAAGLQRLERGGEGDDDPAEVVDKLKRELRHRLVPLMDEVDRRVVALGVSTIPPGTRRTVQLIGEVDPTGQALRYANQLPDTTDRIDFASLSGALRDAYGDLAAMIDALGAYGEGQADALAERRQIESEIEAEYYDGWY